MHTRSRLLMGLLAACVLAGCGGSPSSTGSTSNPGITESTGKDGPGAPPACNAADCQPTPTPQCTADEQCAALPAACSICPDGSAACPRTICENGQCTVVVPSCPQPASCGGIASMPCADGYTCVDAPNDKCDPSSGADCPGVCVPENKPRGCGGLAGNVCPPTYECIDDPGDDCDPAQGGADCTGICQPVEPGTCASDADCPQLKVECSTCADGTAACPSSSCTNGQCQVVMPPCPPRNSCGGIAGVACQPGYECVDDPSDMCDPAAAGADCPGVCQPTEPTTCSDDADCPLLKVDCGVCADGTAACPKSICVNGQCNAVVSMCPAFNACGGIAGTPCERGYVCVDNPNDKCDPNTGGADCSGICVPGGPPPPPPPPQCGGFAGTACPAGFECVDDPADTCDPATGADCGGLCQPIAARQCMADADCPAIGAPCKLCADGTAACPRSFCRNGQCSAVFEGCAPTPS